jgi:hypothetical protein
MAEVASARAVGPVILSAAKDLNVALASLPQGYTLIVILSKAKDLKGYTGLVHISM